MSRSTVSSMYSSVSGSRAGGGGGRRSRYNGGGAGSMISESYAPSSIAESDINQHVKSTAFLPKVLLHLQINTTGCMVGDLGSIRSPPDNWLENALQDAVRRQKVPTWNPKTEIPAIRVLNICVKQTRNTSDVPFCVVMPGMTQSLASFANSTPATFYVSEDKSFSFPEGKNCIFDIEEHFLAHDDAKAMHVFSPSHCLWNLHTHGVMSLPAPHWDIISPPILSKDAAPKLIHQDHPLVVFLGDENKYPISSNFIKNSDSNPQMTMFETKYHLTPADEFKDALEAAREQVCSGLPDVLATGGLQYAIRRPDGRAMDDKEGLSPFLRNGQSATDVLRQQITISFTLEITALVLGPVKKQFVEDNVEVFH